MASISKSDPIPNPLNPLNSRQMFPNVNVKTMEGKIIAVSVFGRGCTILSIKQQIQAKEGFHPDVQRLIYCGKQLDDARYYCFDPAGKKTRARVSGDVTSTPGSYGLGRDVTIHLVISELYTQEETVTGTSTTPATTATTDTDTAPTTPTPTERPTKQTTNGETKSASFHVYVQLPSGTNRTYFGLSNLRIKLKDVDPDATIHSLKYQVEDMMGIPPKLQVLEFKDMALQNEKCLLDYGIDSGAILVCVGPNPKDNERVFSLVNVQVSTRPLYLIGGGFYHTDNSEQSGGMCCGNKMLIEAYV